jgi:hypothetical protein
MSRIKMSLVTAAAGVMLASSTARASIAFVGFQSVAFDPALGATDPGSGGDANLGIYHAVDLMVSISPGDHWAAASFYVTLPLGNFYVPPKNDADTGISAVAEFRPNLNYDTFVTRPGYSDPGASAIFGSASGAPGATMPKASNDKRTIDVAWRDPDASQNDLTGIQAIARLTNSAYDFVFIPYYGALKGTLDPSAIYVFGTPEPTSVAIAASSLGLAALRRRPRQPKHD